jgi:hypothetical protein
VREIVDRSGRRISIGGRNRWYGRGRMGEKKEGVDRIRSTR